MFRREPRRPFAFYLLSLLLICALLAASAWSVSAQQLYQWTDSDGRVHFSNTPQPGSAQPTELPVIQRENIDARIREIKKQTPQNCEPHGGIDCSRGADGDGSVFCLDGYRDAVMPYQFECMEARLHAKFDIGIANEFIPHSRNLIRPLGGRHPDSLQLTLRNLTGVDALGIHVNIVFGRHFSVPVVGPEKVPAFGSADYTLSLSDLSPPRTIAEIEQSRYKVDCTNCSAVLGASAALTQ